jgi:hypothetical protein
MAFHKGNAKFSNVTADDLRTEWRSWSPTLHDDQHAILTVTPLTHAKYFNTKNLMIVSFYIDTTFAVTTPSPYTMIALKLPDDIRIKTNTIFRNQCMIERITGTAERKFSLGMLIVDGETRGGVDNNTFLNVDRIIIQNLGQYIAGQSYTIRGQVVFEPAS